MSVRWETAGERRAGMRAMLACPSIGDNITGLSLKGRPDEQSQRTRL